MSAAVWSEPPQDLHERLGGKVSIEREQLPGREQPAAPRINLRLVAWGVTDADLGNAVRHAGLGPARIDWEFIKIERLTGESCPINQWDGAAVATEAGNGWAYAVYPDRDVDA